MPTYLFRCPACDTRAESDTYAPLNPLTCLCGADMRRDYKAEGAAIAIANLRKDRESK